MSLKNNIKNVVCVIFHLPTTCLPKFCVSHGYYSITGQICYKNFFEKVLEENLPPPRLEGTINPSTNLRSLIRKEFDCKAQKLFCPVSDSIYIQTNVTLCSCRIVLIGAALVALDIFDTEIRFMVT